MHNVILVLRYLYCYAVLYVMLLLRYIVGEVTKATARMMLRGPGSRVKARLCGKVIGYGRAGVYSIRSEAERPSRVLP